MRTVAVDAKLHKYSRVLHHGAERAQEPRQCSEQVFLVLGVRDQTESVCHVPSEREHEEKKGEAWSDLVSAEINMYRVENTYLRMTFLCSS